MTGPGDRRAVAMYGAAAVTGAVGVAGAAWGTLARDAAPAVALVAAAMAAPLAALLVVLARVGPERPPFRAFAGGAVVGPVVAILGHAAVAAFVFVFVQGFAAAGRDLLDALSADPDVLDILSSPWVLVLLVQVVTVAPLVEEAGKALGAWFGRRGSRADAFLAGVSAGAGFAAVENVLYAGLATAVGGPWPAIAAARALGAAVHPLATGLVMLGWWDAREGRTGRPLLRGYLSGVGVHALWNGAMVTLAVAEVAAGARGATSGLGPASLAFTAALGVVAAAMLAEVTRSVASGEERRAPRLAAAPTLAWWTVLAASFALPVTVLVLAFPSFFRG